MRERAADVRKGANRLPQNCHFLSRTAMSPAGKKRAYYIAQDVFLPPLSSLFSPPPSRAGGGTGSNLIGRRGFWAPSKQHAISKNSGPTTFPTYSLYPPLTPSSLHRNLPSSNVRTKLNSMQIYWQVARVEYILTCMYDRSKERALPIN